MANNKSLETLKPIELFLKTGKPNLLAGELMRSADRKQRQSLMTAVTTFCALGVESGEIKPGNAAKRIGTMISLDDSEDYVLACQALEETDEILPKAVEKIVSSLPASKLLQLDPTTGPSAELLIDYATAQQLATLARYYTGKIYAAKRRANKSISDEISYEFHDEDLIAQARVKDAARGLGRLLDLIVDRNDEDSDGLLESFGTALLGDRDDALKKSGIRESVSPSFMIEQIVDMAINKRSSAARVIESLPDGDPNGWDAKTTLRRNIT